MSSPTAASRSGRSSRRPPSIRGTAQTSNVAVADRGGGLAPFTHSPAKVGPFGPQRSGARLWGESAAPTLLRQRRGNVAHRALIGVVPEERRSRVGIGDGVLSEA